MGWGCAVGEGLQGAGGVGDGGAEGGGMEKVEGVFAGRWTFVACGVVAWWQAVIRRE